METQKLLKLQKDLENISKEIEREKGAEIQLMQNLKELGFDSIESAETEVQRLDDLIQELQEELEEDEEKIQKQVDGWDD